MHASLDTKNRLPDIAAEFSAQLGAWETSFWLTVPSEVFCAYYKWFYT